MPPSGDYSAICVFVDRFSKMALFVPTTNEVNAEDTATLFIKHVFCLFGLPDDIVSDRGVTFTSKYMQAILDGLKIKQKLSPAFHPQTDGQTERVNSILEQYLRCYINYQQSDWDQLLPLAQFAYNNSQHTSTGETPFFAVYGFHPKLSFSLPRSTKDKTPAEDRLDALKTLRENMQYNIAIAQETQALYYDKNKSKGPLHKIGDKVWLSSKYIKYQRPHWQVRPQTIGSLQSY